MITLVTTALPAPFTTETDLQVKSISAAWNAIRALRDGADPAVLNGVTLKVLLDEPSDRIPATIRFTLNSKGKIEFKDAAKVSAPKAPKKAQKAAATVVEEDEDDSWDDERGLRQMEEMAAYIHSGAGLDNYFADRDAGFVE